jgi:hypothetical protein
MHEKCQHEVGTRPPSVPPFPSGKWGDEKGESITAGFQPWRARPLSFKTVEIPLNPRRSSSGEAAYRDQSSEKIGCGLDMPVKNTRATRPPTYRSAPPFIQGGRARLIHGGRARLIQGGRVAAKPRIETSRTLRMGVISICPQRTRGLLDHLLIGARRLSSKAVEERRSRVSRPVAL